MCLVNMLQHLTGSEAHFGCVGLCINCIVSVLLQFALPHAKSSLHYHLYLDAFTYHESHVSALSGACLSVSRLVCATVTVTCKQRCRTFWISLTQMVAERVRNVTPTTHCWRCVQRRGTGFKCNLCYLLVCDSRSIDCAQQR